MAKTKKAKTSKVKTSKAKTTKAAKKTTKTVVKKTKAKEVKSDVQGSPHWFPFAWSKAGMPILGPSASHFISRNIYDPSVLSDGNTHMMLYRGESKHEPPTACVGRLGFAMSADGINFQCNPEPILVPDSPYECYGLAHPRLTMAGGVFILTYSAFDGANYRLCLATSTDMNNWFRHGPIFPEFKENDGNITSASVIPHPTPDGRYLMYLGAGDLWLASSENLIDWEMHPKPVLTREKCPDFASKSIEPGPSPFLTKHGLVLVLNGTDNKNHTRVFAALFQGDKPEKCLANLKTPCMEAEADWERFGYLPNVVRATGLTLTNGKLNLYYGGADRYIGIATAEVPKDYLFEVEGQASKGRAASKFKQMAKKRKKVCGV